MSDHFNFLYKTIIVGDSGVGKTSLMMRFVEDQFVDGHTSTIGVDFRSKILTMDSGDRIKLHIWDTSGQERFRAVTPSYYKNAQGVLFVYDVTYQKSFENLKYWIKEVKLCGDSNIASVLVANKCDLTQPTTNNFEKSQNQRIHSKNHRCNNVDIEQAKEYSASLGIPLVEVSTKNTVNVEETFMTLIKEMQKRGPGVVQQSQYTNEKKQCCS